MPHEQFQLAGGSVIGRDHRAIPKNNQDSYHLLRTPPCTVAVVCDGCGSGEHSEVGAQLGSRWVAESLAEELAYRGDLNRVNWSRIKQDVLSVIQMTARNMRGNYRQVINDYFLFTIVGAVLAGDAANFFAIGDGVVAVNGEAASLGPFPGDEPPYLAYALLKGSLVSGASSDVEFEILRRMPLPGLETFLIGSDGVADLMEVAQRSVPGKTDRLVGPLSQFWGSDVMFDNPVALSRRLKVIGRDQPRVTVGEEGSVSRVTDPGLLPDDTTLVVGRARRPASAPEGAT